MDTTKQEVIRALSWKQPYAFLMLHGKIETRKRPTKVRGKVLICSCSKLYTRSAVVDISPGYQFVRIHETLGVNNYYDLPCGVAIAMADLVDCRPMTEADEDKCFVAYKPDLWCWVFENVQEIDPFPYKGKQGWGILTPDIIEQIKIKK